jgi:ABC-2 type transport system ATP-binding protein
VAGRDVLRHPDRVRREIGVAAQRSAADPDFSGRDNLLLQGRLFGVSAVRRRADELRDRFGPASAVGRSRPTPAACSAVSTWRSG